MKAATDGISIATYNVLADAYIHPEYFSHCDPAALVPANRHPRLLDRVIGLDADVLCLQEIERPMFDLLEGRLAPAGYRGIWAPKTNGKPDGVATFVRGPWSIRESRTLAFDDGDGHRPSGHGALFTTVESGDAMLLVVCTHFRWFDEKTPVEERYGETQAAQLLAALSGQPLPTVVCGDFNVEPQSGLVEGFRAQDFRDAHTASDMTYNQRGRARKIDYIMYRGNIDAQPSPTAAIENETLLPSATEPSDHIPLRATFQLRAEK